MHAPVAIDLLDWEHEDFLDEQLQIAATEGPRKTSKPLQITSHGFEDLVRILIVDDDENVASGIRMALILRGYDAYVCGSAEEALERLGETRWALVISDLQLPGVDGQHLLQRVADIQPDARRILITGFGTTDTEAWACREADDYLIKPFSTQRLVQAVQRLLPSEPIRDSDV
ncbi:MAG: response regulator [Anaerolineae bacterium]|nr:response regulator [Anaerolineae bacterium]